MKSGATSRKFPASPAEREAAIARAPGKDRPLTAKEEAAWSSAVTVHGGGYQAVRAAVAAKRKTGQRGPQVAPTKQLVSVRYSPEVLAYFKSGGTGWQTRMDDALKQWVASQRQSRKRAARSRS
jgi:uncharacterized protein (DUF4415 family)